MRVWILGALLVGSIASAQTRGSITLRGRVAQAASVQFYDGTVFGQGVSGSNAGDRGSALDYTLDLGNVGIVHGRDNGVRGGEVRLLLRSNASYVLTAAVTATGFKPGVGEIGLRDIGFGIPSIAPSGNRATAQGTEVVDPARFDSDPTSAAVVDGTPRYAANLADLADGTPLLRGDPISNGGGFNSQNNGLIVTTRYAVLPQYFKANAGFAATVTYTISTP